MRYKLICLFLLLGFVANAQYLHLLERADSSSRKVVVTNNSGIQRYVEVDSLATLLGVNGSVDSLAIIQDTILVYFRSGSELGRDTIGTYNRSQIDAKINTKTDTTAFNQLELVYNPNSQPILNKHYREVDKQTIYIEEINNAAQGVSRLLNTTLTSGRNAYQDAEVVWMADNSDSTVTYSNKGADFTLSRNGNIYGKDNEGAWFEWMNDYPNIDFQENKQKAGLRLFSYIDYGFYRSRVEADTGTLYSIDTCTQNKIDMSLSSSITMIPDGAKAGKLYSIFPNDGSGDFDVTRATTATRVNEDGLIEEVAANVPRIDHTNGCPDLLIEPQRTNLVTYSDFNSSSPTNWLTVFATGTFSYSLTTYQGKPALKQIQTVSGRSPIQQDITLNASTTYTFSMKVDVANSSGISSNTVIAAIANFSDETGDNEVTFGEIDANGRATFTFTTGTDTTGAIRVGLGTSGNQTGTLVYGQPQLEEGSYATSYIPTAGTSVTRNADEIELTGVADLLGDSEGTIYFEFSYFVSGLNIRLSLSDGTTSNRVAFGITSGNQYFYRVDNNGGGGFQFGEIAGSCQPNTNIKVAIKYSQDDFTLYANGVEVIQVDAGNTFTSNELTEVRLDDGSGSSNFYGNVKQLTVFPTALTDTQLENITQ